MTDSADGEMELREQNDGMVVLDGTLSRLPILAAWVNSSAVYWVRPAYPATGMTFMVGDADSDGWAARIAMTCHPVRGLWRVYVPGKTFTKRCETRYRIVSVDDSNCRHVDGEGILRVYTGGIDDISDSVENCYATFPGGAVRAVTVAQDETGVPVFSVGEVVEGAESDVKPIYAYNKATGFYHLVTAFVDEAGEPMLSVADDPADAGGRATFVRDASGFYHRVECAEDTAGAVMLQTGGKMA